MIFFILFSFILEPFFYYANMVPIGLPEGLSGFFQNCPK